jgi:hypothetical protein
MGKHTKQLKYLLHELAPDQYQAVLKLAHSQTFQTSDLVALDESMPGLPFSRASTEAGSGAYHVDDRAVFRPLQYLQMWFPALEQNEVGAYTTRYLVLMSSVHIEALVKRIAGEYRFPLGQTLHSILAKQRIPAKTHRLAKQFTRMYNDAKHEMDHKMDTHLFSRADAVLAYFVARSLACALFPLASLKTNWVALTKRT